MKRSGRKLQRMSNITMILSNVKKTRKKKVQSIIIRSKCECHQHREKSSFLKILRKPKKSDQELNRFCKNIFFKVIHSSKEKTVIYLKNTDTSKI